MTLLIQHTTQTFTQTPDGLQHKDFGIFLEIVVKKNTMNELIYPAEENHLKVLINKKDLVLAECYTNTASLHIMEPVITKLKKQFNNSFKHVRINISNYPKFKNEYFIARTPSYLIFSNGELSDRLDGLNPLFELSNLIEKHIQTKY